MSEKMLEILCIGREILDGRVVDTNSTVIAQELGKIGLRPQYGQKVDDDPERMKEAFLLAQSRSELVLVCGGLGPTTDDRTLEIFASSVGLKMVEYKAAVDHLSAYLGARNRPVNATQLKQAIFPEGGTVLPNPNGTACGFTITHKNRQWFFLPGPPREVLPMVQNDVVNRLSGGQKFLSRAWITQFVGESDLQDKLNEIIRRLPSDWDLSFQARSPEVAIGLHAPNSAQTALFEKFCSEIRTVLQGSYYFEGEHSRRKLEDQVVEVLKTQNAKIGMMESCTGGLIAERVTDVAGSSAVFLQSWVTYANEAKVGLGVQTATIEKFGAVSEAVAREMAECALRELKKLKPAQGRLLCLSTTGIAGPDGGSPEKPVGLCFIGLADSQGATVVERVQSPWKYDRGGNRRYFSQKALALALNRLSNS